MRQYKKVDTTCSVCGDVRKVRTDYFNKKWHTWMCRSCVTNSQKKWWIVNGKEIKERSTRRSMIARCYNKNNKDYYRYWDCGIGVYDERKDRKSGFESFYKYIWPAPSNEYTIDRIDNNKWYEPWNIRWADLITQNNNKRNQDTVEWLSAAAWSKLLWYNRTCIRYHINRWKTLSEAIKYLTTD